MSIINYKYLSEDILSIIYASKSFAKEYNKLMINKYFFGKLEFEG